ncbi:MAG: DUF1232 domain-containing protein [Bauldia sp.]|nr:DUF1232 domain-containing protein [Bauldia sp.]
MADELDVKFGEILEPEDDATRERKVRRGFWKTFRRAARSIPFSEEVVAGYYAATDRATPGRVRATLLAALAYFVLPMDAIPDFIVGIGFGDDATVLLTTLAMVRAHIRPHHRDAARAALAEEGPANP